MRVCSTEYVYHNLLNPGDDLIASILAGGLRPLSDFPESERWQQIETHMPGFFEELYADIAEPVVGKPYLNSGVFVSPIDFQLMPGSLLFNRTRVKVPVSRLDPATSVLTYVIDEQRASLPLTVDNLAATADLWTGEMVSRWFAVDNSKIFYYVPQIAAYQSGGIPVEVERFPAVRLSACGAGIPHSGTDGCRATSGGRSCRRLLPTPRFPL